MSLSTLSIQIGAFKDKTEKQIAVACQKIAMEVDNRLIYKSPVGDPSKWTEGFKAAGIKLGWFDKNYVGGRFRANWGVNIGSPSGGTVDTVDKSGESTIAKNNASIAQWNGRDAIYLTNHLPYAIALENGHSKQAPAGMVRITVAEMQNGAAEAVIK